MTPMDRGLLLISLEAIEHTCTQEKANALSGKKASAKSKTGTKQPRTLSTNRVPKKVWFRSTANNAISMRAFQPLQGTCGCTYYTCHRGLLQV